MKIFFSYLITWHWPLALCFKFMHNIFWYHFFFPSKKVRCIWETLFRFILLFMNNTLVVSEVLDFVIPPRIDDNRFLYQEIRLRFVVCFLGEGQITSADERRQFEGRMLWVWNLKDCYEHFDFIDWRRVDFLSIRNLTPVLPSNSLISLLMWTPFYGLEKSVQRFTFLRGAISRVRRWGASNHPHPFPRNFGWRLL